MPQQRIYIMVSGGGRISQYVLGPEFVGCCLMVKPISQPVDYIQLTHPTTGKWRVTGVQYLSARDNYGVVRRVSCRKNGEVLSQVSLLLSC